MLQRMMRRTTFHDELNIYTDEVRSATGLFVISLMKEHIKIINKYGFRVPLLTSEHKFTNKNGRVMSIQFLRVNDYFMTNLPAKI
jgi:hypothetical protein